MNKTPEIDNGWRYPEANINTLCRLNCGRSYEACLKHYNPGVRIYNEERLLRSLELRYDSWVQHHKENNSKVIEP